MPVNTSLNATEAIAFASATATATPITMTNFGFTEDTLARANAAWVTCSNAIARYRYDGGDPTSAGHLLDIGQPVWVVGNANVRRLRFVRAGTTDTVVAITLES